MLPNQRSHHNEKPREQRLESGPHSPQLEKNLGMATKIQNSQKQINKIKHMNFVSGFFHLP